MSEVSKSQPCSGGTPSASSSGCDVTCCLSDACASLVGRSSKSIRNTNPRSAICPHLSRLNRGSALKILWSSWCDLKAPNCWPRPHPLSLFEMYWALCLSSLGCDHLASRNPTGSRCHEDKHKAPTLPHIRPLSLQDPIRSSTFIRYPD